MQHWSLSDRTSFRINRLDDESRILYIGMFKEILKGAGWEARIIRPVDHRDIAAKEKKEKAERHNKKFRQTVKQFCIQIGGINAGK